MLGGSPTSRVCWSHIGEKGEKTGVEKKIETIYCSNFFNGVSF